VGAFSWLDLWRSRCTSTFAVVTQRQRVRELRCRLEAGHSGSHWHPHFRKTGTPRKTGFPEPFVFTNMREHGTARQGTDTSAATSFSLLLGRALAGEYGPTSQVRANRLIELGSSGSVTGTLGGSGGQRESVGSDE
jgi:hypothetical protein